MNRKNCVTENPEEEFDCRVVRLARASDNLYDKLVYLTARRRRAVEEIEFIERANSLYVEERRSILLLRRKALADEIDQLIRTIERDDTAVAVVLPAENNSESEKEANVIPSVVDQSEHERPVRVRVKAE